MSSDTTILEGIGDYKFGFRDPDELIFKSRKGLDRGVVEQISAMKGEPEFARQAQHVEMPMEDAPTDLTARQREILTLVSQGLTYPQVGEALHLTEPTVRHHMGQILERLHLENRSQVIAYAARHGLTSSSID